MHAKYEMQLLQAWQENQEHLGYRCDPHYDSPESEDNDMDAPDASVRLYGVRLVVLLISESLVFLYPSGTPRTKTSAINTQQISRP
jgi:hypothetical protein